MQSITIGNNQAGQRLDKFLRKYLPEAGSSFLYKMLRKKNITLNGKKAEGKEMLSVGDQVCFFFSDETFAKFTGGLPAEKEKLSGISGNMTQGKSFESKRVSMELSQYEKAYGILQGIDVLYEDANILILNKPAGILTQKALPSDLSLNEWLIGYLLATGALDREEFRTFHPSVCNRLDRNTSGIVLCGKSLAGSQALSRVIKERTVRKFYRTICVGALQEDREISGYLGKDSATNKVTICEKPRDGFSKIQTAYHPLCISKDFTILEVELITGRTHQIRAHLAQIGHPLIGDYKYGVKKINDSLTIKYSLEAQLLHAYRIEFPEGETGVLYPLNGKSIVAPCPERFIKIQEELKLQHMV